MDFPLNHQLSRNYHSIWIQVNNLSIKLICDILPSVIWLIQKSCYAIFFRTEKQQNFPKNQSMCKKSVVLRRTGLVSMERCRQSNFQPRVLRPADCLSQSVSFGPKAAAQLQMRSWPWFPPRIAPLGRRSRSSQLSHIHSTHIYREAKLADQRVEKWRCRDLSACHIWANNFGALASAFSPLAKISSNLCGKLSRDSLSTRQEDDSRTRELGKIKV